MTSTRTYKIAVFAGDGIGKEVIPAGIAALEAATRGSDVSLSFTELPWGCDYYLRSGRMMDEDGFDRLATFDSSAVSTRAPFGGDEAMRPTAGDARARRSWGPAWMRGSVGAQSIAGRETRAMASLRGDPQTPGRYSTVLSATPGATR